MCTKSAVATVSKDKHTTAYIGPTMFPGPGKVYIPFIGKDALMHHTYINVVWCSHTPHVNEEGP